MERIKQELLDKGFIVHTKTKEQMENVIEFLETVDSIKKNTNPEFWKYHKEDTILDINNFRDGEVYYGSKLGEKEYVYDYDDIWEHCGGVVKYDDLWEFDTGTVIFVDPEYFPNGVETLNLRFNREHSGIFTGGNKMREYTKIENRIEELEKSIWGNGLKLEELKVANKYSDMNMEISSQLSLIDKEKKLLKGYETLDNMEIGNVIINNGTVIVISLYGKKAISKLSEGDSFNFLAGFFLCLTKLGSAIDTYFYDYSIHVALEDIELGNL